MKLALTRAPDQIASRAPLDWHRSRYPWQTLAKAKLQVSLLHRWSVSTSVRAQHFVPLRGDKEHALQQALLTRWHLPQAAFTTRHGTPQRQPPASGTSSGIGTCITSTPDPLLDRRGCAITRRGQVRRVQRIAPTASLINFPAHQVGC